MQPGHLALYPNSVLTRDVQCLQRWNVRLHRQLLLIICVHRHDLGLETFSVHPGVVFTSRVTEPKRPSPSYFCSISLTEWSPSDHSREPDATSIPRMNSHVVALTPVCAQARQLSEWTSHALSITRQLLRTPCLATSLSSLSNALTLVFPITADLEPGQQRILHAHKWIVASTFTLHLSSISRICLIIPCTDLIALSMMIPCFFELLCELLTRLFPVFLDRPFIALYVLPPFLSTATAIDERRMACQEDRDKGNAPPSQSARGVVV